MFDQQVRVNGPEGEVKKFAFHRCYWSTDDSLGKPPVDNSFVFNDIGKEILHHIFEGFNATIFAYGQTGAGKSYSIEGYEEKGLLQMCLDNIFNEKMA
jgi:kinesin family protein 1